MNYIPIHTNVSPNYNYLSAENAFLKQDIEYKNAVICEQQATISKFRDDVSQLSQANMKLREDKDCAESDAEKWRVMKQIVRSQGGEQALYYLQATIDKGINHAKPKHR
jgi:uncharacterized coiled-coil protein SlyX